MPDKLIPVFSQSGTSTVYRVTADSVDIVSNFIINLSKTKEYKVKCKYNNTGAQIEFFQRPESGDDIRAIINDDSYFTKNKVIFSVIALVARFTAVFVRPDDYLDIIVTEVTSNGGGGGGGGSPTDLSWVPTATDGTIHSSTETGGGAVIPSATQTIAGLLSAADKKRLDELGTIYYRGIYATAEELPAASREDFAFVIEASGMSSLWIYQDAWIKVAGSEGAIYYRGIYMSSDSLPAASREDFAFVIGDDMIPTLWVYQTSWIEVANGGGEGNTNLSITEKTATSLKLNSSTQTNQGIVVPSATEGEAGLLEATNFVKLRDLPVVEGLPSFIFNSLVAGDNIDINISSDEQKITISSVGGGTGKATNLSIEQTSENLRIDNDNGTGVNLPFATQTLPGIIKYQDKIRIDNSVQIADFANQLYTNSKTQLKAGQNITITSDDTNKTFTISSTGGVPGGTTNLSIEQSAYGVKINNDNGTGVDLPLATEGGAGIISYTDKTKIDDSLQVSPISTGADLNTLTVAGYYSIPASIASTLVNAPPNKNPGTLTNNITPDAYYGTQIYLERNNSSGSPVAETWVRTLEAPNTFANPQGLVVSPWTKLSTEMISSYINSFIYSVESSGDIDLKLPEFTPYSKFEIRINSGATEPTHIELEYSANKDTFYLIKNHSTFKTTVEYENGDVSTVITDVEPGAVYTIQFDDISGKFYETPLYKPATLNEESLIRKEINSNINLNNELTSSRKFLFTGATNASFELKLPNSLKAGDEFDIKNKSNFSQNITWNETLICTIPRKSGTLLIYDSSDNTIGIFG